VVVPGVRYSRRKEVPENLGFRDFAQVDSVLSADGRRPVRRALVYRTTVIRFFLRSLRLPFAALNLQVSDNLNTLLFNNIVRVTAASRILPL